MKFFQNHLWIVLAGAIIFFCMGFYCGKLEQQSLHLHTDSIAWEQEEILIQNQFYITGEIVHPGLYQFSTEICLMEAIEMAGGIKKTGDIDAVNPARSIKNGEKIVIPSLENTSSVTSHIDDSPKEKDTPSSSRININTASLDQLMLLPTIGQTRAEAILQYRETIGSFVRIEDLMEVAGIGTKTFETLKELVCVDGSSG